MAPCAPQSRRSRAGGAEQEEQSRRRRRRRRMRHATSPAEAEAEGGAKLEHTWRRCRRPANTPAVDGCVSSSAHLRWGHLGADAAARIERGLGFKIFKRSSPRPQLPLPLMPVPKTAAQRCRPCLAVQRNRRPRPRPAHPSAMQPATTRPACRRRTL